MNTKFLLRISTAVLIAGSFTLAACQTTKHVAYHTGKAGEAVVHGTGRGVAYVGHGIGHAGDEIAEHTR